MNKSPEPIAVLTRVERTYQLDAVSVPVIKGVDLLIRAGHFTVLLGPSGSGKTTLLNMIGCIDRPDHGEVIVAGCAVNSLSDDALSDFRAKHIGFIFQNLTCCRCSTRTRTSSTLCCWPAPRRESGVIES